MMPYGPAGETGTVTVHVNEPSLTTSTTPSLHEVLVPLKYGVTAWADVNPEPVSATWLSTVPVSGPNVSAGVTVNGPPAVIIRSSDVYAAIPYGPAGEAGTVIVQLKNPSLVTITGPSLHEEPMPPKYGVTVSPAVNP